MLTWTAPCPVLSTWGHRPPEFPHTTRSLRKLPGNGSFFDKFFLFFLQHVASSSEEVTEGIRPRIPPNAVEGIDSQEDVPSSSNEVTQGIRPRTAPRAVEGIVSPEDNASHSDP